VLVKEKREIWGLHDLLFSIAGGLDWPEVGSPVTHSYKYTTTNDVTDRDGQQVPP